MDHVNKWSYKELFQTTCFQNRIYNFLLNNAFIIWLLANLNLKGRNKNIIVLQEQHINK